MAVLGSIQPQPVETQADGTLRLADIAAAIKPDDPHFARTRLVVLENTTGGQVLPTPHIAEVAQLARAWPGPAPDGARLFNAATANAEAHGTDVYDEARALCQHFDTVSLCLSRAWARPWARCCWAVPISSARPSARARSWRRHAPVRPAGRCGQHALQHHVRRLVDDHALLRQLAAGLAEAGRGHLSARRLAVASAHTNILFTDVHADGARLHGLAGRTRRARDQQPLRRADAPCAGWRIWMWG